jgi:hypothetical protein
MRGAIFCITSSEFQAESAINGLKVAGFTDEAISALLPGKVEASEFEGNGKSGHKAPSRQTAGRTMGWLDGPKCIPIPGFGPFYASGPMIEALGGHHPPAREIAPALEGMGLSVSDSKRFEKAILNGGILLSVHSETFEQNKVRDVLENAGAQEISVTREIAVMEQTTENQYRK